jgi:nitrate reductase NapAB chaperone NapD
MMAKVCDRIDAIPDAEICGKNDDGQLVVVLDSADNRQAADTITSIQNQADILSAILVYQYNDQSA